MINWLDFLRPSQIDRPAREEKVLYSNADHYLAFKIQNSKESWEINQESVDTDIFFTILERMVPFCESYCKLYAFSSILSICVRRTVQYSYSRRKNKISTIYSS